MQRSLTLLSVILLVINISSSDSEDERLVQVRVIITSFCTKHTSRQRTGKNFYICSSGCYRYEQNKYAATKPIKR